MNNTNVTLSIYEKQQLLQNRMAAITGLYVMASNYKNGVKLYGQLGTDEEFTVDDVARRQYQSIADDRPIEEIIADVERLWEEIRDEILETVKPYTK